MPLISRRRFVASTAGVIPILTAIHAAGQTPLKLLFVHGRAQGGRSEQELRAEWLRVLEMGAQAIDREIPSDIEIELPFFGERLDELAAEFSLPLASDITTRGDAFQDEFLAFQEEVANQLRVGAGITNEQIDEIYGDNERERGPENWEWVQAIIKSIDLFSPGTSEEFLEHFLRDVFIYIKSPQVRSIIDAIVIDRLDERPTIVVAHSLGTVIAYHILKNRPMPSVPLFMSLGSPLGINAIKRQFRPLRFPLTVDRWINAFDERDVVSLHPLDATNFPVTPSIDNVSNLRNQTANSHGISGYLDKATVVGPILDALEG